MGIEHVGGRSREKKIYSLLVFLMVPLLGWGQGTTVFITQSGESYHRDGCRSLSRSKIAITLSEAVGRGYESCKICRPVQTVGREETETPHHSLGQDNKIIGRVIAVNDGDTITVLSDNQQYKIRFNGIDAPESTQDFGSRAKQFLSSLVYSKTVTVIIRDKDRYGRYVADVYWNNIYINLQMVQEGLAWHYKHYSRDTALAQAETEARRDRIGLWNHQSPTPPWDFRRN